MDCRTIWRKFTLGFCTDCVKCTRLYAMRVERETSHSRALCFCRTVIYISRTQYKEYCVVRRHKIGGLAPGSMAENSRGAKFRRCQLPVHLLQYHLTGFYNAYHTLQRNKSPHGKEHLLHTQSSDKTEIEELFCRGGEDFTI